MQLIAIGKYINTVESIERISTVDRESTQGTPTLSESCAHPFSENSPKHPKTTDIVRNYREFWDTNLKKDLDFITSKVKNIEYLPGKEGFSKEFYLKPTHYIPLTENSPLGSFPGVMVSGCP